MASQRVNVSCNQSKPAQEIRKAFLTVAAAMPSDLRYASWLVSKGSRQGWRFPVVNCQVGQGCTGRMLKAFQCCELSQCAETGVQAPLPLIQVLADVVQAQLPASTRTASCLIRGTVLPLAESLHPSPMTVNPLRSCYSASIEHFQTSGTPPPLLHTTQPPRLLSPSRIGRVEKIEALCSTAHNTTKSPDNPLYR